MTTPSLYKVLGPLGQSIHGGFAEWALPNGKPGKWMPKVERPKCCTRGYHLVELHSLPEWLAADCTIYLAEGRGATDSDGSGKTAYEQARLIRRLEISEQDLRLFAADCAEHVLPIFLKVRPDDTRPAAAIEAARRFARGEIDAAGDAARAAAGDAAGDAAWDAAWAAAGDAAGAAARAAAWAAARAAAGDAAGDAARAAAGAAAWAAAWDAERRWQSEKLETYLKESAS